MDLYTWSLVLGVVGLAAMAFSGIGHHGQHGHAGHDAHTGYGGRGGRSSHGGHVHGAQSRASTAKSLLWSLASPRVLFSFALGFGAAGALSSAIFHGLPQLGVAVLGGAALERLVVTPLWNFSMRFASAPAETLDTAVTDHATAVTSFDANGQGIVRLEVDGQVVQILATLQAADRQLGVRVRAGAQVRIEDVDPVANRCTVSLL